MSREKINVQDLKQVRLLVSRMLLDNGVGVEASKIRATLLDDEITKAQLHLSYPLRKARVAISSLAIDVGRMTDEHITIIAQEQASAFLRVTREAESIERALAETRSAAMRELSTLRRKGLDVSLVKVQPSPIDARGDRLPLPETTIQVLGANLVPRRLTFTVSNPADIAKEMYSEPLIRHQTVRAVRKDWMALASAAGAIDGVIVAALQSGGVDVADVIRRMLANEAGFKVDAGDRAIDLHWRDGLIGGDLRLDEQATYRRGEILLERPLDEGIVGQLRGSGAADILENALLDGHVVASAATSSEGTRIILRPRYHLFDRDACLPRERLFPM